MLDPVALPAVHLAADSWGLGGRWLLATDR